MKPTVGRIVLFHPTADVTLAAIIAGVRTDNEVNLAVFDTVGASFSQTGVQLVGEGGSRPESGSFCEWPPYQIAQARKPAESVVATLTVSKETADALARIVKTVDMKIQEVG